MSVSETILTELLPDRLRHALVTDQVWLLQELRDNPDSEFEMDAMMKLECIFFHIPKTAGISVTHALFGSRGIGHVDVQTARRLFGGRRLRRFFKFCFVRNPYDRAVSAYFYLRERGPSGSDDWVYRRLMKHDGFNDFAVNELQGPLTARDQHFRPQIDFVADVHGHVCMDFVGRFERLNEDFAEISQRLRPEAVLPHRNASAHNDYREYYSTASRSVVEQVYRSDLAAFDYQF